MANMSCNLLPTAPLSLTFSNMQSIGATTRGMAVSIKDVYRQSDLSGPVGKEKFHAMQCTPPKMTPKMANTIIREYLSVLVRGA